MRARLDDPCIQDDSVFIKCELVSDFKAYECDIFIDSSSEKTSVMRMRERLGDTCTKNDIVFSK